MAEKQTAGRDRLGGLAPKFAELNDDVLFPQAMRKIAMLAWIFDECREDQISCCLQQGI